MALIPLPTVTEGVGPSRAADEMMGLAIHHCFSVFLRRRFAPKGLGLSERRSAIFAHLTAHGPATR